MGGLGLVLSGGGAPAAYFGAGVIRAVERAGLEPTLVSGVSAGALNACAVASGLTADELTRMWLEIGSDDLYRVRRDVWNLVSLRGLFAPGAGLIERALGAIGWTYLLDSTPARETLVGYLGGEELPLRRGRVAMVSAVDEASGEVVRFCSALPRGERRDHSFRQVALTVDHMLASAAVPLLFPAGRVDEATYVDAGLVANTPLAPVMAYEPEAVIVVSGAGLPRPARVPRSLGEAIELAVNNVAHHALMADYRHAQTFNALAVNAPEATEKRPVPMLLIEPLELGFRLGGFLHFDAEHARRVIAYGEREGERALADWEYARRAAGVRRGPLRVAARQTTSRR